MTKMGGGALMNGNALEPLHIPDRQKYRALSGFSWCMGAISNGGNEWQS